MARNGSGSMSIVNTFTASTRVRSADVNDNFTDIATELTNSLPRDGQAAMTGQFKSLSGSISAPGMSWGSELGSGWYRAGSADFRYSVAGADVLKITASGATITGNLTVSGTISGTVTVADGAITTAKIADANVTAAKLANTAVTAGSYNGATITVDAQGRLTAASANPVIPSQTSNSGKYLTTDGTNPSWGTLTSYTQPTTLAAIGTYAMLYNGTGGILSQGATAAGSSLSYAQADGSATTATTGTWRLMGIAGTTAVSVWLRIS